VPLKYAGPAVFLCTAAVFKGQKNRFAEQSCRLLGTSVGPLVLLPLATWTCHSLCALRSCAFAHVVRAASVFFSLLYFARHHKVLY